MVRECHDFDAVAKIDKHNVVRECVDRHASNVAIVDSEHESADLRKLFDELKSLPGLCCKSVGDSRIAVSVPTRHFAELDLCRNDDLQRLQRPSTSFSTRSRTTRQSVLSISPARAAATLLRISLPHASSTPSSASLRLSRSSAAILARSSSGNSKACSSRSRVVFAMSKIVARPGHATRAASSSPCDRSRS